MMEKAKVLFVSQEIMPYMPETEIARVSRKLPQGILERGKEIRTFMPRYGSVNERRNQLHEVIRLSGQNLIIEDTDHPLIIKVASIQSARMQVYFIDNDDYFHRKSTLSTPDGYEHSDNDERAIFFARGVLETTKKLHWEPDVIHCHGWFTSFVPIFVKALMHDDPHFVRSKIVISLYDVEFKDVWQSDVRKKIYVDGLDQSVLGDANPNDYLSLMKLAIDLSDGVVQGSAEVNAELLEYVKQSGKPFLSYQDEETYIDAYNAFYDQIIGQ